MPVSFLSNNNKKVLHIDYSGLKKKEEMMETLQEVVKIFESSGDERFLVLIDITDSAGHQEWMEESKKYGKRMGPKTIKSAIVGVTGLKKVLLMGYNAVVGGRVKPYGSKEAALDYLTKD